MEDENKDIEVKDIENNDAKSVERVNPFKKKEFYIAYFLTTLIQLLVSVILDDGSGYLVIIAAIYSIPAFIVSLLVWIILRKKNKPIALGILFGGSTLFITVLILTGGCGLLTL